MVHGRCGVAAIRSWQGPGLLRLVVPRLSGHSGHDSQAYKPEALVADEWERDPLPALRAFLVPGTFTESEWERLVREVEAEVVAAREKALSQPEPCR